MTKATKSNAGTGSAPFYTEECGLALMQSRRTGKKFCIDKDAWTDVVSSMNAGWRPWNTRMTGHR